MGFCKTVLNIALKILLTLTIPFLSSSVFADEMPKFNMYYGVTPISQDIYDLHMTIFWICVVIGVIVFSLLIYALIMHRKSRGVKPSTFHENKVVEIIWAIVPLLILIIMAIPATIVLVRMNNDEASSVTIKITGYQWKWQYSYLDQGIQFFSNLRTPYNQIHNQTSKNQWYLLEVDKPLVVPINEKIRFLITSNDVIHSWWVPALGVKRDGMPGFIHEAWATINKPGIYRGQCAELCGVNHGFMPIVVEAVTRDQFDQWVKKEKLAEQSDAQTQMVDTQVSITPSTTATPSTMTATSVNKTYTADELMKQGQQSYNTNCSACHQINGTGIPPIYPPLLADSVAVGKSVTRHIDLVLNGVPGTAMQAFASQLSDFEIAAIVTYERNAWGNRTGDVVQPSEVAKQREIITKEHQAATQQQAGKALQNIQAPAVTNKK